MATVPNQRTWASNYKVTAADLNANVRDAVNFLLNPPCAQIHQATAQSIPNNAFTAVAFDTADQLGGGDTMWVATAATKITSQTAGTFQLSGQVSFLGNATGERAAYFRLNGTTILSEPIFPNPSTNPTTLVLPPFHQHLNVGDYVELLAFQNSGGALNTYTTNEATFALARWVSNQ